MIIVAPWARGMRNGEKHPKNYPWWREVISQIDEEVVQVGYAGEEQIAPVVYQNMKLTDLADLAKSCKTWISVDSFFQHFCWDIGKPGIVIFGQSDPNIFGHPENINLLKDRSYLREKQFWLWEQCTFNEDAFVKPDVVIDALRKFDVKIKQ